MATNYKFHAIALTSICCAVTGLYFVLKPSPQPVQVAEPQNSRYIEVYSATWGRECNPYIEQALAAPPKKSADGQEPKDANGNPIKQEKPKLVTPDNVLPAVSAACNSKLTCELTPTSDSLGVEPLAGCFKKLEVSYRCFAFDKLHQVAFDQGKTATIDCKPSDEKPAAAAPATPAN